MLDDEAKAGTRPGDWLTRQEAAQVLHCSLGTVDRRLRANPIVTLRHGRRVLVSRASLEAFLARCRGQA